ncbi:Y-family DNA polymerase [Vibrio mediterranei]|uniref:Y-family DNA polymerase n=1 Tax=Vibrio mediterranei TaxID=689 RepID=UPI0038CE3009
MFLLIDVHSMYCSAETIHRPDLRHKDAKIVVMSNGDGIAVAVNKAAKQAGIRKFEPLFKQKQLIKANGVKVFSSNYTLYSKVSDNLVQCLIRSDIFEDIQQYSIDEVFASLPAMNFSYGEFVDIARSIRRTVWQHTRLPVGVGIGQTFTLSKVASWIGKNAEGYRGICVIPRGAEDEFLRQMPVREVWNIGRATAELLQKQNISTAYDLSRISREEARRLVGIQLERVVMELRGEQVYSMQSFPDASNRHEVTSSISLTQKAETAQDLHQALSDRISVAAEKLRRLGFLASSMTIFARTNHHYGKYIANSRTVDFINPVDDTRVFLKALTDNFDKLYEDNAAFYKIGCRLQGLVGKEFQQGDLFAPTYSSDLMKVMDSLNERFGQQTLSLAAQKVDANAKMTRNHLSPNYLSQWKEIPRLKC